MLLFRVILAPCVFLRIATLVALIVLVDYFGEISGHTVEELVSDVSKDAVFVG